MKTLAELREALKAKAEELKVLSAKEDYGDEDDAKAKELAAEMETLKGEISIRLNRDANQELAGTYEKFLNDTKAAKETPAPATLSVDVDVRANVVSPATYSSVRLNNIKGEKGGLNAHTRAYNFGMWALAAYTGHRKALAHCEKLGVQTLAHMEGDNAKGGWLVPEELSTDIIDLRDQYGIFRQFANVKSLKSDHWAARVRKGGLEAYPIGEGQEFTKSYMDYGDVSLTPKKWGVLSDNSTELAEDTFISWADEMTGEIARAFAKKEDECGFFGDGTSDYHGITGIIPALKGLSDTVTQIAGLQQASGNAWSEITLDDLISVTGRIRSRYVRNDRLVWICSQQFYTNVMVSLALAANGNAATEIVNGVARNTFLGFPVIIADNFPIAEANSQVPCLFGSLRQGIMFGDRTGIAIAMSEHADFENDMILWRGRERFDISCWNIGNAAASAADLEYGPIAGLIMAGS